MHTRQFRHPTLETIIKLLLLYRSLNQIAYPVGPLTGAVCITTEARGNSLVASAFAVPYCTGFGQIPTDCLSLQSQRERIRTSDLFNPSEERYQTAPHADI